jgi:hypothetical protein
LEATRDVQIGEYRYQITRFNARDGSWLVGQFLTRGLALALEPQEPGKQLTEQELAGMLAVSLRSFSEEDYEKVRVKALSVVRRYENKTGQVEVPMPLLMANNLSRWAVTPPPDIVDSTVILLASLSFNLHCFFAPGALEKLLLVFPGGSQSAPGSTGTSSDQ